MARAIFDAPVAAKGTASNTPTNHGDCDICRRSFARPRGWLLAALVLDAPMQARLVFFELNDQIGVYRRRLESFFAAHGVERDDAVCKSDFLKKLLRRRNLVGFLVDFDMRQHKRAIGGEGAQELPRLKVVEGVEGFLERVAVERQSANAGNGLVIVEIRG